MSRHDLMPGVRVLLLLSACSTAGCSLVDRFGPRVDTYNETALASKNRLLLQNIVRAAFNEPLQWSTVNQIQGTASISATLGGKLTVIGHRAAGAVLHDIDPSVMASGGPTFTVPLLDTKEFQAGIQTPVSVQTIRTFMDQGYPLDVLLPLFVSSIEFGANAGQTAIIDNFDINRETVSPGDNKSLSDLFNGALRQLITQGLTIENRPTPIGPPIFPKDLNSPKTLTDALGSGLQIKQYDRSKPESDHFLTPSESKYIKSEKSPIYYRTLQANVYRFCFDTHRREHEKKPETDVLQKSNYSGTSFGLVTRANNSFDPRTMVRVTSKLVCGYQGLDDGNGELINFTMRSTEGVIRFLGAAARLQIQGDGGEWHGPTVARYKSGSPVSDLFRIYRGAAPGETITASHAGDSYSITTSNYPNDYSGKVLSLLQELVNLNNSVKDQPIPNVVSVIAR